PDEQLTATDDVQPAVLAHSAAVFAVVGAKVNGVAVAAAGHSLGEYSAYVTAGALAATDAVALVRRRGELMHAAGTERPGTMAAVLGLPTAEVEAACRAASRDGLVAVAANLNAPDQTVISGDPAAVASAGRAWRAGRAAEAERARSERGEPGHGRRGGEVPGGRLKIDLADKVGLVTGGSRGIGYSIAQALAGAGAKVAVLGRDGPKAEQAARSLGDSTARGFSCDVANAQQVERTVGTVEQEFGRIDILVNNAGTTRDNLLFRINEDDWSTVLD